MAKWEQILPIKRGFESLGPYNSGLLDGITKKTGGSEVTFRFPAPADSRSGYAAKRIFGSRFHARIPASESAAQVAVHHLRADL